jgi:predicted nucleic acid-binding protein
MVNQRLINIERCFRGCELMAMSAWPRTVLRLYGDRVLPFNGPTAEIAGVLADLARGHGHFPSFADIAISATARRRFPPSKLASRLRLSKTH